MAWRALGYALTHAGEQERAGECFLQAVALNPGDAEAHFNLGLVFVRLGRFEAGIGEMRRAINIDPSRMDFRAIMNRHIVMGAGSR